jgi:hypothetical protein
MMKPHFVVAVVATILINSASDAPFRSLVAAQAPSTNGSAATQGLQQSMQDMMKMHAQMMAQMRAADVKLDGLVKEMDTARGEAKVVAIAAVVTELVGQNKSAHEHMDRMHQQMMGGRAMMMNR